MRETDSDRRIGADDQIVGPLHRSIGSFPEQNDRGGTADANELDDSIEATDQFGLLRLPRVPMPIVRETPERVGDRVGQRIDRGFGDQVIEKRTGRAGKGFSECVIGYRRSVTDEQQVTGSLPTVQTDVGPCP